MPKNQFLNPDVLRRKSELDLGKIQLNAYEGSVLTERESLGDDNLKAVYYDMAYIRLFENALYSVKENKEYNGKKCECHSPFHLSMGQEAGAVGQAFFITENDFIFGSHRSHGEVIAKGFSAIRKMPDEKLLSVMKSANGGKTYKAVKNLTGFDKLTVKEMARKFFIYGLLAEILVKDTGFSRGISGSMHAFFMPFGIYPNNAVVGGSANLAVGSALYKKVMKKGGVVIANIGDGAIGCGPVWEAMGFATMDQFYTLWEKGYNGGLPVIFNFFDNQYAMNAQTVGETMGYGVLARVGAGVTKNNMMTERVDGFNPLAVIDAYRRKLPLVKKGKGACMLDVLTYRFVGHNTGDSSTYRSKEEIEAWEKIDPIITYADSLIRAGVMRETEKTTIDKEIKREFDEIFSLVLNGRVSKRTNINDLENLMYSNGEVESFGGADETLKKREEISKVIEISKKERIKTHGKKSVTFHDAMFEAVLDKCYKDKSFVCYGEECRDWGNEGDIYRGLKEVLPYHRLFNTGIAESAIVGSAVGYAMSGGRVMAELMFIDFLGRAGDEVFNQLPKWQALATGEIKMPLVLKVKVGAKYGAQHSQDWSAFFMHVPGLKVVYPVTPYDAKGLMATALNGTDPVIFLESQRLFGTEEIFTPVPKENYYIEIGKPSLKIKGTYATVLSVGATLYRAKDAVNELKAKYNLSCDLFDARSICPFDYTEIVKSVKKTGRILLVSDECERCSVISEMASKITTLAFKHLKRAPVTLGAKNWITPPYEFEKDFFPQKEDIIENLLKLK